MPTLDEIKNLRDNQGLTFGAIGARFGKTPQAIQRKYSGYDKKYRQTETSKRYRLHYESHNENTKLRKPCTYCAREFGAKKISTPLDR